MSPSQDARMALLAQLATVLPGYSPKTNERQRVGKYLLLGGHNIDNGRLIHTEKDAYITHVDKESFRNAIAQPGDIIVSTPSFYNTKP